MVKTHIKQKITTMEVTLCTTKTLVLPRTKKQKKYLSDKWIGGIYASHMIQSPTYPPQ